MRQYYVYILASGKKGTLYIGVTSNLLHRVRVHKNKSVSGFTQKYGVDTLVYFEVTHDVREAILKEKQIKKWNREWKIRLIEEQNPQWRDMYEDICGFPPTRE